MAKATKASVISIRDICYISIFTAVIACMAQIAIPLPGGVPLTLQTLAVPLAGIILGARRGTIAAVVYVLRAMAGVPVLSNLNGGIGAVLGVTGGFVMSFPVMAFISGAVSERGVKDPFYWAGLLMGVIVNYAIGTLWFVVAADSTVSADFTACVLPIIPTGILKWIVSGLTGDTLKKALKRAQLL